MSASDRDHHRSAERVHGRAHLVRGGKVLPPDQHLGAVLEIALGGDLDARGGHERGGGVVGRGHGGRMGSPSM